MNRKIGTIFSFLLLIIEVASNFLFLPFLINVVGEEIYGVYSLVLSISSYLTLLDLGLGNALIKYMSKFCVEDNKDKINNFCTLSTIFYSIIGILILIFGCIIIPLMPSFFVKGLSSDQLVLSQQLMILTLINVAATFVFLPFDKLILAKKKYTIQKSFQILKIIVRIGGSVLFLNIGFGIIGVAYFNLISTLIFGVLTLLYDIVVFKIKPKLLKNNSKFIKEIFSYTGIIFVSMIATQINNVLDQILIGALVSASAGIIAVYAIGAQLYHYFQTFANCINGILMPEVVTLCEKDRSPNSLQSELTKVSRVVSIGLFLILIGFIVLGKEFISLWVGSEMLDAYYVGIILMISIFLCMCQSIGVQMLWALNAHKEHAILKFVVVCLNIFLTIILIKWNPLIGASLGTAISIFVGDVLLTNIIFYKKLKINIFKYYIDFFKGTILVSLFVLIFALGFKNVVYAMQCSSIMKFVIVAGTMAFLYVLLMYLCGFNQYEKKIASKFKNKFILFKRGK